MFEWRCVLRFSWSVACIAVVAISTLADSVHAAPADDVVKKIEELNAALTAFDGKTSVAADINGLRKLLRDKKLLGNDAADVFVLYSNDIQDLLKDDPSAQLVRDGKAAANSVTALLVQLNKLAPDMPDTLVKERFIAQLDGLTGLINKGRSSQVVLTETLLVPAAGSPSTDPDPKVRTARANFDTAWAKITEDQSPKIHIIRSWFGDLRTNWREGRLCAATSAIMKKCEARPECVLDAAPAGQPNNVYDQQILCGFDPAPLVDPAYKGVATEYSCVRGGKLVWEDPCAAPRHQSGNPHSLGTRRHQRCRAA